MNKSTMTALLATAGMSFVLPAQAELSSTLGLYSDYVFRGVSQTLEDPAVQVSFDWANEDGWYAGIWGSNVDFGDDAGIEVDYYGGYAGETGNGLGYDFQLVYYTYPSSDDQNDYPELLFNFNYNVFKGLIGYTWDNFGTDESALYLEGGFEHDLGNDFGIHGSVGYSDYSSADNLFFTGSPDNYVSWNLGVSKSWNGFDFALDYFDTNDDGEELFGSETTDSRVVLSISRSFSLIE